MGLALLALKYTYGRSLVHCKVTLKIINFTNSNLSHQKCLFELYFVIVAKISLFRGFISTKEISRKDVKMDQAIFTVGCFFASMCNTSFAVRLRNVLVSFQLKTLNKYLSGWGRKCTLLLSLKMITHSFYSKAKFGLTHNSFLVLWLPGIVTCLCFCKTIPRATLAS